MSRNKSISLSSAMQKLQNAAKAIDRREGVKPHEQRRVQEALTLLANGIPPPDMGARSQSTFLDFVKKVHKVAGLSMVVLVAVGLGKSNIGFLKDNIRLELPYEIHRKQAMLENEPLQRLAEGFPAKYVRHPALDPEAEVQDRKRNESPHRQPADASGGFSSGPTNFPGSASVTENQSTDYVSLDLKLSHLIQFLQHDLSSDLELRMICPLYGIPLPYIYIESQSSSALKIKIEFALRSSEALIRYVLNAKEPPH